MDMIPYSGGCTYKIYPIYFAIFLILMMMISLELV
jgi:hypothetical protein